MLKQCLTIPKRCDESALSSLLLTLIYVDAIKLIYFWIIINFNSVIILIPYLHQLGYGDTKVQELRCFITLAEELNFRWAAIPWTTLLWLFFRKHLFRGNEVYLLARDKVVIGKSGKQTYELNPNFSQRSQAKSPEAWPELSFNQVEWSLENDRVLFGGDHWKVSQHRACSLSLKSLWEIRIQ